MLVCATKYLQKLRFYFYIKFKNNSLNIKINNTNCFKRNLI